MIMFLGNEKKQNIVDPWFDDEFLVKRYKEQELYLIDLQERLHTGNIRPRRYVELRDSALFVKEKLKHQLERLHPIKKIEKLNS